MQPQNTTLVEPGVYKMNLGVGSDGVTPQIKYVDKTGANLLNYKPAMQTTSQQTRQDITTGQKIDAMSGATPTAPNSNVQNNGQPTTSNNNGQPQTGGTNPDGTPKPVATPINYQSPDGTTVQISETAPTNSYAYTSPTALGAGEKFGYGSDGKRYIVGKAGEIKNDTYADQEYKINEKEIKDEKNRTEILDRIQLGADAAHSAAIERIKTISAYNRQQMKDTNARYLALKQNEGFSGGQARYMSDINNGILQDNEQKGIERLNKIDIDEVTAIAEATQAKTDKDFARAAEKMDVVDKLQKEKRQAILDVLKATNDFNTSIKEQQKAVDQATKEQFNRGVEILKQGAPALLEAFDAIKSEKDRSEKVATYAKSIGVTPEQVLGAIKDQRTQNLKDTTDINAKNRSNQPKAGNTTVDEFGNETTIEMTPEEMEKVQKSQAFFTIIDQMIAAKHKDPEGVPVISDKGYLTYKAFKDLLDDAVARGISREDFINRYQSRVNLSTTFNRAEEYGLTKAEYTKLKNANK